MSGKPAVVLTISGNIVDILHQPHGLGEEGGPRRHSGHPGFLFPSGSTSRKNWNYCLILDSVVSCLSYLQSRRNPAGKHDGLDSGSGRSSAQAHCK